MPALKKVKLKRGLRRVHPGDRVDDEAGKERERKELVAHLIKVGTQWRYVNKGNKVVPKADVVRVETLALKQEDVKIEEKMCQDMLPEVPAGATLVCARDHPEFAPFIRMVEAGVEIAAIAAVMTEAKLDASVLFDPGKNVILAAHLRKKEKSVDELYQYTIELETEKEAAAAQKKIAFFSKRRPLTTKLDPALSIQQRQLRLLQMADCVSEHNHVFDSFVWRNRLGDPSIGYTVDTADFALTKGVITLLGPRLSFHKCTGSSTNTTVKSTPTKHSDKDENFSSTEVLSSAPLVPAHNATSRTTANEFKHGSLVYKLERTITFIQMLGYLSCLDLNWPVMTRTMLNWTAVFLDAHLRPLLYVHKFLYKIKSRSAGNKRSKKNFFAFLLASGSNQKKNQEQKQRNLFLIDTNTIYTAPNSVVDLYFYRDILKYLYSLALAAVLLIALFLLWQIGDYTDPKITDRWIRYHVERWWSRGVPRSFCWLLLLLSIFVGIPAALSSYTFGQNNGHYEHSNAILISGGSFGVYLWLIFLASTTIWSKYFRSKLSHNKAYAAIAVLKETVRAKCTLCLVLLFLTYKPTCFYIFGSLLPIHSTKVWSRHGAHSATEPLESSYYHTECYFLSFPPRIRPKRSRARKARIVPPGYASYPPHPYHTHEAINRVECTNGAGVLLFCLSSIALVLYLLGLPLIILHLTRTACKQLHFCDWWQNYMTAWRRFTLVAAECEKHSLIEVIVTTAKLWKHDKKKETLATLSSCFDFFKRLILLIPKILHGPILFFRLAAAICSGPDHSAERLQEQRTKAALRRFQSDESTVTPSSSVVKSRKASQKKKNFIRNFLQKKVFTRSLRRRKTKHDIVDLSAANSSSDVGGHRNFVAKYDPRDDIPRKGYRLRLYKFAQLRIFHFVIAVAVLVSLLPMFLEDSESSILFFFVLWVCGLLFLAEFAIKITALQPRLYFHSAFNCLDFSLVVLWLLEVAQQGATNLNFLRSLRALRSARMIRMARMARTLRLLKLGHHIDPILFLMKVCVIHWVADTPLSNALLERLESSGKAAAWRIRTSLPAKIEKMKSAFLHAKKEYSISFDEFSRDHELVIEDIDIVIDTSALGYLIWPFKGNAAYWRVVLLAETLCFSAVMTCLKASQLAWKQCLAGAFVRQCFAFATTLKRPYMYLHERYVDECTRLCVILILILGMVIDLTPKSARAARAILDGVCVSIVVLCTLRLLYLLRVHEFCRNSIKAVMRYLDASVLSLFTGNLEIKCYALENSNYGLRLIQQWDELLRKQRATGFLSWPITNPPNLLSFRQKLFHVRWAALRKLYLSSFRTPTGQCILHIAMLKAEPEAVAWILHHHPTLLKVADDQRDTPIVIALKELAKILLKHNEGPSVQTEWKRSKLAEILLSDQIQNYAVPWNLPHYRALGDIAIPFYGELIQQLSLALNLQPPAGFVRISKWTRYPGDIPDFLGQCFLACRDRMEAPSNELGDFGKRTFQALLRALAVSKTSITITSNFFTFYPIHLVRFAAAYNRLRDDAGLIVAECISANKSLVFLDLRHNYFADESGTAIAQAIGQNQSLTLVTLAHNRLGAQSGLAFAQMITANHSKLKSLNLASNRLGPRLFWRNLHTKVQIDSSGPALCAALRHNFGLTYVNLSDNQLGPLAAIALDKALRHNPDSQLISLGLAGNCFSVDGGKALTRALKSKIRLTHLDASRNSFGSLVGIGLASSLRRNNKLVHLDISQNNLGTKSGRSIALALQENKTLTALHAKDNNFGPDVLRAFSTMLLHSQTMVSLGLGKNRFGISTYEGGSATGIGLVLGEAVQQNATLTELDLSGLNICEECLVTLIAGLGESRSIIKVSLDEQIFDNAAVLQLTNSLDRIRQFVRPKINQTSSATQGQALMNFGGLGDRRIGTGLVFFGLEHCSLGRRAGPIAAGALLALKHVRELSLAGNAMGAKLAEQVGQFLLLHGENCNLKKLNLAQNDLGETGGLTLARAMERNTSLTDVNLADNGLTALVGAALADAFCEVIESGTVTRRSHVARLCLNDNFIGTQAAEDLLFALRSPSTRAIHLARNGIGSSAGMVVSQCLRRNTIQWRYLDLQGNHFGKDGANQIFWALRRNVSLCEINLSDNDIGPDFGTERDEVEGQGNSLASAIEHNYALQTLKLANNRISFECGIHVTQALHENPSITELDFEANCFDAAAGQAIAAKLANDYQIRRLCLRHNNLGWEGGVALANSIAKNDTLVFLDLSFNELGTGGPLAGSSIGHALSQNSCLCHLHLGGCLIGPEAGIEISLALQKNNTLITLDLTDNHFDVDVGNDFLRSLAHNTAMLDLRLSSEEVGNDVCADVAALMKVRAVTKGMATFDYESRLDSVKAGMSVEAL